MLHLVPSRTTRRPPPKHRAPRSRRLPRPAGTVGVATASFAVAATATVSLQAGGTTTSSHIGATGPATSSRSAAALGRAATGDEPAPDPPTSGRAAYAGAEERLVLRATRLRPVSRDVDRHTASRAEQHGSGHRAPAPAWALPVAAGYRLSAGFGECSGLWGRCHTGLDFAAPSGTPVLAVAAGRVTEVGWAGAYGNRAVLMLGDGTEVWYCHLDAVGVGLGTPVAAGDVVGTVGTTGNTTGPHLHLEVRPSGADPVDPAAALASHGLTP